jgi:hypothetical protein
MNNLHKLLRLTGSDRHLLFRTFVLLYTIRLGLRILPFRTLLHIIGKASSKASSKTSQAGYTSSSTDGMAASKIALNKIALSKIVWAVEISSHYTPGGAKCLARALTTKVLLSRQGDAPDLRIGVSKGANGNLEAHAWIENQGQVVMGNLHDLARYIPLPSLEGVKL